MNAKKFLWNVADVLVPGVNFPYSQDRSEVLGDIVRTSPYVVYAYNTIGNKTPITIEGLILPTVLFLGMSCLLSPYVLGKLEKREFPELYLE